MDKNKKAKNNIDGKKIILAVVATTEYVSEKINDNQISFIKDLLPTIKFNIKIGGNKDVL